MPPEQISKLSIGNLKSILATNHVNARLVVEKEELVAKVITLVADERKDRADAIRRAIEEEQEMRERMAESSTAEDAETVDISVEAEEVLGESSSDTGQAESGRGGEDGEAPPAPPPKSAPASPPKVRSTGTHAERSGLCVVCQDEEANIAIVDCG